MSMNLLKIKFLLLLALFSYSCTKAPVIETQVLLSKDNILKNVEVSNPPICMIKSKGVFFYENRFNRAKFKGTIHKTCESEVTINVLGMFGQVYAQAVYNGTELEVIKDDENITEEYSIFFNEKQISQLIKVLNIPFVLPDETFNMRITEKGYFFKKANTSVLVNQNFKIVRIRENDIAIRYGYDANLLKEIEYKDATQMFNIKLSNPDFNN